MTTEKVGWWKRNREGILAFLGTVFVLGVGAATGYNSWWHIVDVGLSVEEPGANLLPVAIDGMMLGATVMGALDNVRGMKMRGWAVVCLWLGAALTLTFNMLSAYERGVSAMAIAVLYAVCFLGSVEMLFHPSRTPRDAIRRIISKDKASVSATEPAPAPAPVVTQPTQVRTFPPRPDRSKGPKPWEQRTGKPGSGNGGKPRPERREERQPKPMQVTVLTEKADEAPPPAMAESVADIVGMDVSGAPVSEESNTVVTS